MTEHVYDNGPAWTADQWYHYAATYVPGGRSKVYVDGVEVVDEASAAGTRITNNASLVIGSSNANEEADGVIDEARMSATARSADWIATEYNNQSTPSAYLAFGGEESSAITVFTWDDEAGDDNWTSPTNWNQDAGYPDDALDYAIIGSGSDTISSPSGTTVIGGLTLGSGFNGTLSLSGTLDVNGSFNIDSGTFQQNNNNLFVSGTFSLASGITFVKPTTSGTLYLDGDQTFFDGTSPQQDLGRVLADPTTTLTSDMTATSLTIPMGDTLVTDGYELFISGTIDINGTLDASSGTDGNTTIDIGGVWDSTGGTFTNTNSTVLFTGTSGTQTFAITGTQSFNNVKFDDNGGGTTWELEDTMTVDGTFYLADGVFDTNSAENNSMYLTGTIQIAGGDFNAQASSIQINSDWDVANVSDLFNRGTSTVTLAGDATISNRRHTNAFWNLKQNNGVTMNIENIMYVKGTLTAGDATSTIVDADNGTEDEIYIRDTTAVLVPNGVVWNEVDGLILLFDEGVPLIPGDDYGALDIIVRETPSTVTSLGGDVITTDQISVVLGTLDFGTYNVTAESLRVGGNVDTTGGFIRMGSGTINVSNDVTINDVDASAMSLIYGEQADIYVGGDWNFVTTSGTLGQFNPGTSTITFNSTAGTSMFETGGSTYHNVSTDDAGGTLTVQLSGTLDMTGSLTITDGTFDLDGYETFIDGNVDIDDELDASSGSNGNTTVHFGGDWDMTGGTFTSTDSTVFFTGTADANLYSDSKSFNNFGINDGLVGYWKLDDTSSLSVDSSGYQNHLTWNGTPLASTSVSGTVNFADSGSVDFNTGDYLINSNSDDNLNDLTEITIAAWIYPRTSGQASFGRIVHFRDDVQGVPSFLIGDGGGGTGDDAIRFEYAFDSTLGVWNSNDGVITYNQWQHVAVTYSNDSVTNDPTFYRNGTDAGIVEKNAPSGALEINDSVIIIGNRSTFNRAFDGLIDDVRVYKRILSSGEIAQLANGNMPRSSVATLTLEDTLDVAGSLVINSGTFDTKSGESNAISVAGNWNNNGGVFIPQNGTVTLDGGNQTINASETFYNISKQITSSSTLTFAQSSTITIQNNLDFDGFDATNYLTLQSSSVGTRWNIDVAQASTVTFVDVRDSEALSNDITATDSLDTSNNDSGEGTPQWVFGSTGSVTNVYYSVGTDTGDLSNGGNVSITGGVATFTVAQPENVGVGDEITAGGTEYYISGRTSSTVYSVTTATGATPANIGATAVTDIERTFNTLSDAESMSDDAAYLNNSDLTAAGADVVLNWALYNDGVFDGADGSGSQLDVAGYTTDSSHYVRMFVPSLSGEVGISQRHSGKAGTGVVFRPTIDLAGVQHNMLSISDNYVRLEGVEIDGSNVSNAGFLVGLEIATSHATVNDIHVDNLLLHSIQNSVADDGDNSNVRGIFVVNGNVKINNTMIYNIINYSEESTSGVYGYQGGTLADNQYIHNVTMHNILNTTSTGGEVVGLTRGPGGTLTVKNTYCGRIESLGSGSIECISGADTQESNVSSDGTASGTGSVIGQNNYDDYFVMTDYDNMDLHWKAPSEVLFGTNGTLDIAGTLIPLDDIDGNTRLASAPDIGADEWNGGHIVTYSVGTDTSDLKNGSPNITITDGVATLSVAQTGTIGIGDEITAGGNEYYIIARRGNDTYAVQTAIGAKPSDLASTAVTDIERTFNTLSDIEGMSDNAAYLNNTDITASGADVQLHWALYNDDVFNGADGSGSAWVIQTYTTDADHILRAFAPTGTLQVPNTQRHNGTAGTGARIVPTRDLTGSSLAGLVQIFDNANVRLEGLEIDGSNVSNAESHYGLQIVGDLEKTVLDGLLLHDIKNSNIDDSDGSFMYGIWVHTGSGDVIIRNSSIYNIINVSDNSGSQLYGLRRFGTQDVYLENVTLHNVMQIANNASTAGISFAGSGALSVRNSYCGRVYRPDGTAPCFSGLTDQFYNVTSDSSASGVGSVNGQNNYDDYFVMTDPDNMDLHWKAPSEVLFGTNGTLDIAGTLIPLDDIDGNTRSTTAPDIGFDEWNGGHIVTYSVGTDTSDLKNGSPNITITDGVATLSVAQTGTIGIGDEITAGGNEYYVVSRRGNDTYAVQTATGAKPADLTSTAVTSIQRTFNTLTDTEDDSDDAAYLNNTDLTSTGVDVQLHWALYNDGVFDGANGSGSGLTIDGYSTDSNKFIRLFTPTGTLEVGTSQRHVGTQGTGVVIRPTIDNGGITYNFITISDNYVRIDGLELDGQNVSNMLVFRGVSIPTISPSGFEISNTLIHGLTGTSTSAAAVYGITAGGVNSVLKNNMVFDLENQSTNASSFVRAFSMSGGSSTIYNSTVLDIKNTGNTADSIGYFAAASGDFTVRNSYCGDVNSTSGSESCFSNVDTAASNVSSDATATGTGSVINQTDYSTYFVNVTAGNQDLHLRSSSESLWGTSGVDLSSDGTLSVNYDIEGEIRAFTPDIGADEFSVATFTWDAGGDAVTWTDPTNWDAETSYPKTSAHTAIINTGSATIVSPAVTTTIGSLRLGDSFNGTLSITSTFSIEGSFALSGGTFQQNDNDVSIGGDFTIASGATFVKATSGTLTFDNNLTFTDNTDPLQDLGRLVVDPTTTLGSNLKASSLKILENDTLVTDGYNLYITGSLDINGTLDATSGTGGNSDIHVGGNWDATGGMFTSADSTVMFIGTTAGLTITSNTERFDNLIINGSIGLVGYWKLDEATSPAIDYSGYGHSGTWGNDISNISTTSGTINFYNPNAADFDGTDDYIEIADTDTLDLDDASGITIAAWIYPRTWGQSTQGRIVDKGGGAGNEGGWAFHITDLNGSGQGQEGLVLQLENAGLNDTFASDDFVIDLNEWQHVAVTWEDATNIATFYVNGQPAGNETEASSGIDAYTDPVRIGMRASDSNRDFDGYIDEVRVYARALSATEIQRLGEGNMPGTGVGTYTLQDNLDLTGTLTLNDGTLDANGNYVQISGGGWLNHGGVYTASGGDVYLTTGSGSHSILSGSQTFYHLEHNGGATFVLEDNLIVTNEFSHSSGGFTYVTSTVIEPIMITGDVSMIGGTFTGQSTRFRHQGNLTVGGGTYTAPTAVLEITGSFTHSAGTFTNSSSTIMFVGTDSSSMIDASGGAIFQDVIVNDSLVGYWPLDEASSPARDLSGNEHTGVWINAPTSMTDTSGTIRFANSRSLDFTPAFNEYVDIGDHPDFDLDVAGKYTWSVWIKSNDFTASSGWPTIFSQTAEAFTYFYFYAHTNGSTGTSGGSITNGVSVWWVNGEFENPGLITEAENVISEDIWEHIAITYDGDLAQSNRFTIYVNGVDVTGSSSSNGVIESIATTNVRIASNELYGEYFDGAIDDLRLYNRLLSSTEIQAVANGGQPSTGIGVYTLANALDINGTLRLNSGTLDSSASNYQLNVAGDWENFGGVFNARSGTVILDGASQQLPASETFYNIQKQITSSSTLTFGQSSTITIQNNFDFDGFDASNYLTLQSSSVGTRWNIDLAQASTVTFVDVRDSEALSNDITATDSLDTSNNDSGEGSPQWSFTSSPIIFTWDSGGDSVSWTDPLNWDQDSNYPQLASHAALIMTTADSIATPSTLTTIGSLTIGGSYSGTVTLGGTMVIDSADTYAGNLLLDSGSFDTNVTGSFGLTVDGSFEIDSGATNFNARGSTVTVGGSFVIADSAGLFTAGTSTIDLVGTGSLANPNSNNRFYHVKVGNSGQTTAMITSVQTQTLEIGAGVLTSSAFDLNVVFNTAPSGTKIITSDPSATVDSSGGFEFSWFIQGAAETYYIDGGNYSGVGILTFLSSTANLQIVTRDLTLQKLDFRYVDDVSTFDLNDFNATIDTIEYSEGLAATLMLGSGTVDSDDILVEPGKVGIIDLEGAQLTIANDIVATNGTLTFIPGTSTVTFDGTSGTSSITNVQGMFNNVIIADADAGSDLVVQLAGTLDMTGTLSINDGSLVSDGYEIYVDGTVDINDELDISSGTDGNSDMHVGGQLGCHRRNIYINRIDGNVYRNDKWITNYAKWTKFRQFDYQWIAWIDRLLEV